MNKFLRSAILLIIFLYQQNSFAESKILVSPFKIEKADFYEKYTAIGQVKLSNSIDYFAKVSGKVDFVSNVQGAELSKNDILIIIDKDLAEQSKSEAEAELYLAESNYNRDLSLLKNKFISEEVINKSKASFKAAKNKYTKVLNTYDNMVIKASEDGYLGVVKANIGDDVKIGDYLFSVTTKSSFYIFVELPETLHGKVLKSDLVKIREQNKEIDGKILAISDYISNTGTLNAKFEFPYNEKLLHGSFVEVDITFNNHKNIAIPEKALMKNNQGDFVYAITPENKIKQLFVKLGVRTNNMIELLSGDLKEGDMVVLDGLTKVYDGAEVTLNLEKK